jgi:hypothetical protein
MARSSDSTSCTQTMLGPKHGRSSFRSHPFGFFFVVADLALVPTMHWLTLEHSPPSTDG